MLIYRSMGNFTLKKFLITLGLSIVIWVISMAIQNLFAQNVNYGFFIFAKSCEVTGYPVAMCIPEYDKAKIYMFYFLNIFIWQA